MEVPLDNGCTFFFTSCHTPAKGNLAAAAPSVPQVDKMLSEANLAL